MYTEENDMETFQKIRQNPQISVGRVPIVRQRLQIRQIPFIEPQFSSHQQFRTNRLSHVANSQRPKPIMIEKRPNILNRISITR